MAWRLKEQVGAGRDGPRESTEAAPMGVEAENVRRVWAEVARIRETLPQEQGSLTVKDLGSTGPSALKLTPSPRLGGLKEVTSPLRALVFSICSTWMVRVPAQAGGGVSASQSCPTSSWQPPKDHSPPGPSLCGVLPALYWVDQKVHSSFSCRKTNEFFCQAVYVRRSQ